MGYSEADREQRVDRWLRVAIVAVMVVGLAGLALAGFGFWTDRVWAIITGYAAATPLMLVYPTIILTLLMANWRQARRDEKSQAQFGITPNRGRSVRCLSLTPNQRSHRLDHAGGSLRFLEDTRMLIETSVAEAVQSPQPLVALRSSLLRLLEEGHDRAALLEAFGDLADRLREAGREAEADLTLEGMDLLSDWCSPQMRLDAK